jgi:hypothetical protein
VISGGAGPILSLLATLEKILHTDADLRGSYGESALSFDPVRMPVEMTARLY